MHLFSSKQRQKNVQKKCAARALSGVAFAAGLWYSTKRNETKQLVFDETKRNETSTVTGVPSSRYEFVIIIIIFLIEYLSRGIQFSRASLNGDLTKHKNKDIKTLKLGN